MLLLYFEFVCDPEGTDKTDFQVTVIDGWAVSHELQVQYIDKKILKAKHIKLSDLVLLLHKAGILKIRCKLAFTIVKKSVFPIPWDLQRMGSTCSYNQVLSRGHVQDHIIFIPKTEEDRSHQHQDMWNLHDMIYYHVTIITKERKERQTIRQPTMLKGKRTCY